MQLNNSNYTDKMQKYATQSQSKALANEVNIIVCFCKIISCENNTH